MECLGSELGYKQRYLKIIHRVETSIADHVKTGGSQEEGNRVGLDIVLPIWLQLQSRCHLDFQEDTVSGMKMYLGFLHPVSHPFPSLL